jgi:lysophospholipase L1-like esterase
MALVFGRNQRLLFIGDSITDCGRREGQTPYGSGYVNMVRNCLLARSPELRLTIVNRGVGGDTVRDLAERWEMDVIAKRPDWLSLMIGINDVWRGFGSNSQEAVPLPEYEETLHRLLDRTLAATSARLILCDPYMIEPDKRQPMRQQMDLYGAVVKRLAEEYQALHVPVQAAFDAVLTHSDPDDWAADRIHPNEPGHAVIALAWLRAVGFEL